MKKISTFLAAFFTMVLALPVYAEDAKQSLDFTVDPPYTDEITEMPSSVSITIAGYSEINPVGCKAHMTGPDGFDKQFTVKNRTHQNTITFTIGDAANITTSGEYTVTIPTSALLIGFDNLGNFADITFTYRLKGNSTPVKPEINYNPVPAAGDITEFPKKIKVTFPDEDSVFPVNSLNPIAQISGPNGFDRKFSVSNNELGNTITIDVNEEITAAGEYTVTIPSNALVNADNNNLEAYADLVFKYNFKPKPSADIIDGVPEGYTVFPEPGTRKSEELVGEFKITLTGFTTASENVEGNYVTVFGPAGQKNYLVKNGVRKMLDFDTNEYKDVPDASSLAFEVDPSDFKSPGTYTMTAKLYDLETNPADMGRNFKWTYVVENTSGELPEAIVDIQPATGEVTEFPSEIKVTYKGQMSVFPLPGEETPVTITGPNNYNQKFAVTNTDVNSEISNTITIAVDPVPTEPGKYTVTIPGTALGNGEEQTLDKIYKDVVFTYTLLEKEPVSKFGVVITPDPKAGVYPELPEMIVVKFPKLLAVTGKDNKLGITMKIECPEHNISDEVFSDDNENNYKGYNFKLDKKYTLPGTYTCTVDFKSTEHEAWIDAWTKTLLDEVVEFEYVVGGITTRVEPAPGIVEKITEINLTVTNAEKVELAEDAVITLKNAAGTDMAAETSVKDNVLTVKANPEIIEEGEYTLAIAAGSLLVDGLAYGKAIYVDYSIKSDAIDAVFAGETSLDIYGIDGTVVVRKATRDDLRTLSKGIYVVGGKKVIVK